jgi:hypothetical protein
MTSSYRKTVEKLAEQMSEQDLAPCPRCREPTRRATLGNYGARCQRCYDAFCAEGMRGGAKGIVDGAADTALQVAMRKALEKHQRRVNAPAEPLPPGVRP